jgi:hypothetical protein
VPQDTVANFSGQIQALALLFEQLDDAHALFVVTEPTGQARAEGVLAGVSERGVAQVTNSA